MWRKLQFAQIVRDFRAAPIHRPDKLAPNDSVAVNDVGFRPAKCAVEPGRFLRFIPHRNHVDAVVFEELVVRRIVRVNTDGEHHYAFTFETSLHPYQRWGLFDTRRTPRRPKIQQHHLPAKLAERDFMVGILQREVRGIRTDARGMAPAVASDQRSQQSKG